MKQFLAAFRNFALRQWYRFQLGVQFLVFLNFVLLLITASDKLQLWLGIPKLRWVIIIFIPVGIVGMWLFGFILDRVVKMPRIMERTTLSEGRSAAWEKHLENFERVKRIEETICGKPSSGSSSDS